MDNLIDFGKQVAGFLLIVMAIIFVGFWAIMGCGWIIAGYEHTAWNELHGTHYTQMQWFSGSDFIKKYHYPGREETAKSELDVNVNS